MFDVLVEPNRRRILEFLLDGERSAGDVVDALEISQPAVSKHLKVLRDAGMVSTRPAGTRRLYRLEPVRLRELDEWLAPYRQAWEQRIDALGNHLESMQDHEP